MEETYESESEGEGFDWVYGGADEEAEVPRQPPNQPSSPPPFQSPPSKLRKKYTLPPSPAGLHEDPRTELPIVDVPPNSAFLLFVKENGIPIVHFYGNVEKMNRRHSYDGRLLVVTNYCLFLLYPQGGLCRCTEIAQVNHIYVHQEHMGLQVIGEPDMILSSSDNLEIVTILRKIYHFKKHVELDLTTCSTFEEVHKKMNNRKPRNWKVASKYVHSKWDLYKRLEMLNAEDESLEYLSMTADPRTGLPFVDIPKEHTGTFRGTPFSPFGSDKPVLFFFDVLTRITKRGCSETRCCLVSTSTLYLTFCTAKLSRTLDITTCSQLFHSQNRVACKAPRPDFDLLVQFDSTAVAGEFVHVLCVLHKLLTNKPLPVTSNDTHAMLPDSLNLRPPRGYKPISLHPQTKTHLINQLRQSNIRPLLAADRGSLNGSIDTSVWFGSPATTTHTTTLEEQQQEEEEEGLYGSDPSTDG